MRGPGDRTGPLLEEGQTAIAALDFRLSEIQFHHQGAEIHLIGQLGGGIRNVKALGMHCT